MSKEKVICQDMHGENKEVDASELIFRPSVYGILIEDGKILLSKQWDGYDFPGGGVEIAETINEALEREFWEETGLKIKRGRTVVCESSFFTPSFVKGYWNCQLMYFLCEKVSGELSKEYLDEDEQGYADIAEWINLGEVDKIKFYNSVDSVKVIKEALKFLGK
ncbi:MAG: NUDIX domain-containing protein [Patescibacteria group bacterium]|nr:NUDIX domain-containing protein [Patescibacteria group bacterium]MDD4610825.1 NUDIX domain-containing protein [Patescibacteria group bacterium]